MLDSKIKECIELTTECHATCVETFTYCLGLGGRHRDEEVLRLLLDCAEVCQTAARLMLHRSAFHARGCALCAEICRCCAEICGQFPEDKQLTACAESCRRCAESCASMSETAKAA
jgi:hypothetical protein